MLSYGTGQDSAGQHTVTSKHSRPIFYRTLAPFAPGLITLALEFEADV